MYWNNIAGQSFGFNRSLLIFLRLPWLCAEVLSFYRSFHFRFQLFFLWCRCLGSWRKSINLKGTLPKETWPCNSGKHEGSTQNSSMTRSFDLRHGTVNIRPCVAFTAESSWSYWWLSSWTRQFYPIYIVEALRRIGRNKTNVALFT